jgi:hypothetical protein
MNFMQNATQDRNKDTISRIEQWFAELDKFKADPFLFDREQPTTVESRFFKESDGEYKQS